MRFITIPIISAILKCDCESDIKMKLHTYLGSYLESTCDEWMRIRNAIKKDNQNGLNVKIQTFNATHINLNEIPLWLQFDYDIETISNTHNNTFISFHIINLTTIPTNRNTNNNIQLWERLVRNDSSTHL